MRKIDLILENIRDEYMINLLEEGTASELETLKTKKFLNENLNRIRKMLIEEGTLDGVKEHLGDNWGKYLAGAELQENAYSGSPDFIDRAADSGKKNWKQYAAGAGLGALGVAGAHVLGDGETLEDLKSAYQQGNLMDTIADKTQNALGGLKNDVTGAVGTSGGTEQTSPFGDAGPQVNKLKDALEAGSGKTASNQDIMNSIMYKHAGEKEGIVLPWHNTSPDISDEDVARYERGQYQQAHKEAMSDNKIDAGEMQKLQDMANNQDKNNWFLDSDARNQLEASMTRDLAASQDWLRTQGYGALLNGNLDDDAMLYNQMQQRLGGIPKEAMPVYREFLRARSQS